MNNPDCIHDPVCPNECPCDYFERSEDEEVTSWCVQSPCKDETPSNADRIRGMNDEELAKFMGELPCCPPGADAKELCYPMDACEGTDLQVQCWLDWLKEEVTANDS